MLSTSSRSALLAMGAVFTAIVVALGFTFFKREEFLLNLTSEAAGVLTGGLVLFALIEIYLSFQRRREWARIRDELFDRILWELEILQFSVRPMASWHIGWTLGEELRELVRLGPGELPIQASYFLRLTESLGGPLDSLNVSVTPRVISLADDKQLTQVLLDLEASGLIFKVRCHSLTEDSPESAGFTKMINEILEKAAIVADQIELRLYEDDAQKAAQARFERLEDLDIGPSWSSDTRTVYKADGTPYQGVN